MTSEKKSSAINALRMQALRIACTTVLVVGAVVLIALLIDAIVWFPDDDRGGFYEKMLQQFLGLGVLVACLAQCANASRMSYNAFRERRAEYEAFIAPTVRRLLRACVYIVAVTSIALSVTAASGGLATELAQTLLGVLIVGYMLAIGLGVSLDAGATLPTRRSAMQNSVFVTWAFASAWPWYVVRWGWRECVEASIASLLLLLALVAVLRE